MIKFPTDYRVGELRGNQVVARECYVAMMEMDDHLQAMSIEEHRITTEPVEKFEEVFLDDSKHEDLRETLDTFHSYNIKLNPGNCAFGVTAGKFLGHRS